MKQFAAALLIVFVLLPFWTVADKKDQPRREFLSPSQWEKAPVQENIRFNFKDKTLDGHLSITHDKGNLYLLLTVYQDDFYLCKDADGVWAEDRLFIILDENGDSTFTDGDEDRVSVFVSEFVQTGKPHRVLYAAQGDWYFENAEKDWEWSLEKDWELEHIPDQYFSGGPDVKEACFFQTGNPTDGEVQDYVFEVKIPLNSRDPFDLQANPGDTLGIGIMYGNVKDSYASFPPGTDPDESPSGFLKYRLVDEVKPGLPPEDEPVLSDEKTVQGREVSPALQTKPKTTPSLPAPEKKGLEINELMAQVVSLEGKVIKTSINRCGSFEQVRLGEYRAWCGFWGGSGSYNSEWVTIPEEGKKFFQELDKQNNWGGGGGKTIYLFVRGNNLEAVGTRYRKDKNEYSW